MTRAGSTCRRSMPARRPTASRSCSESWAPLRRCALGAARIPARDGCPRLPPSPVHGSRLSNRDEGIDESSCPSRPEAGGTDHDVLPVHFCEAQASLDEDDAPATAPLHEQANWRPEELREGVRVSGRYAPSPRHLRTLIQRWALAEKGLTSPRSASSSGRAISRACSFPGSRAPARLRLKFRPDGPGAEIRSITRQGLRNSTSGSACSGPRRNWRREGCIRRLRGVGSPP